MNDLFRHYMLSWNNEAERDQIRERLLADQAFSDEMRERETDWIDAYAAGRLPPEDRALLHAHLASTGQLGRVATAAALARVERAATRSIFPYALAIAAVVLLCFGAFLASSKRHVEIAMRAPQEEVVALLPGTLRDNSSVQRVVRKPGRKLVLQLLYQDTAPIGTCIVTIKNSAGEPVDEAVADCGLDFHPYPLSDRLTAGRYNAELVDAQKGPVHTYLFDLGE